MSCPPPSPRLLPHHTISRPHNSTNLKRVQSSRICFWMSVHCDSLRAKAALVVLQGAGKSCECMSRWLQARGGPQAHPPSTPDLIHSSHSHLRVGEGCPKHRHREPIDKHQGGDISTGQEGKVGSETIRKEGAANCGKGGAVQSSQVAGPHTVKGSARLLCFAIHAMPCSP